MLIVFAYDIPDDRRRLRVAKLLDGVADRVQYSVFEGHLDDRTLDRTIRRLDKLVEAEEDSIRVYRLCATCRDQIRLVGRGQVTDDPDVIIL